MVILCDNASTIAIAVDPKYHSKAKYIERYYYIRDMIKKQGVLVQKVSSNDYLSDSLAICLAVSLFNYHV